MRVGDQVRRWIEEHRGFQTPVGPIGTLLHVQTECIDPCEGHEVVSAIKVLWEDGSEETLCRDAEKDLYPEIDLLVVTPLRFVNVYRVERAYGGPEEGGWWYDCGEVASVTECQTEEDASRVADEQVPAYPECEGYEIRVEAWPGENFPQYRPYYC